MESSKQGEENRNKYKFNFDSEDAKIIREKNLLLLSALHYVCGKDWSKSQPDWQQVSEEIKRADVSVYADKFSAENCEKQYISLMNYGYQVGVGHVLRTLKPPARLLDAEKRLWILATTSNDLVKTSELLDSHLKGVYQDELHKVERVMNLGFEELLKHEHLVDVDLNDEEELDLPVANEQLPEEQEQQNLTESEIFKAVHSKFLKDTLGLSEVLKFVTYCSNAVQIAVNELPRLVAKRKLIPVETYNDDRAPSCAPKMQKPASKDPDLTNDDPSYRRGKDVANSNSSIVEVDLTSSPTKDPNTLDEPKPKEKLKVETFKQKTIDRKRASSPDIIASFGTSSSTTKVLKSINSSSASTSLPKISTPARTSVTTEVIASGTTKAVTSGTTPTFTSATTATVSTTTAVTSATSATVVSATPATVTSFSTATVTSATTLTVTSGPRDVITTSTNDAVIDTVEAVTGTVEAVSGTAEAVNGTAEAVTGTVEPVTSDTSEPHHSLIDQTLSTTAESTTKETSEETESLDLPDKPLSQEIGDINKIDGNANDGTVVTEVISSKDVNKVSVEEITSEPCENDTPLNEEEDNEPQSTASIINEKISDETQVTTISSQSPDGKDEESDELNTEDKIDESQSSNEASNMSEDIVTCRDAQTSTVVDIDEKSMDINPPTPPAPEYTPEGLDSKSPIKSPRQDADLSSKSKNSRKSKSNPTRISTRLNSPEPTPSVVIMSSNDDSKPGKRQRGRHGSKTELHVPVLRSRRGGTPTKSATAVEKIAEPEEPPTPNPVSPTKVDISSVVEETPVVQVDIAARSSPAEVEDKLELKVNIETKHKELQVYKAKLPSPLSHVDPQLFGEISDEDDPELAMIDSNANKNREEREKSPELKSYSRKGRTVSSENNSDPGNEEKSNKTRKRLTRRTLKQHDATVEANIQEDSTPTGQGSDKATSESSFIRKPKKTRSSKHAMRLKRLREEQQQFFGDADSDCSDGKRVTRARAKTGTTTGSSSKRTQLTSVGDSEGLSEPELATTPKRKSRKRNPEAITNVGIIPQINFNFSAPNEEEVKKFRKHATIMLTKIIEAKQGQAIHRMSTDDPDRIIKHRVDFQSIRRKVDFGVIKDYQTIHSDLLAIGVNILYSYVGRRYVGDAINEYKNFIQQTLDEFKANPESARIDESEAESVSSFEERVRPSGSGSRRKRKRSTSETSNEEVFNAENKRVTRTSTSSASMYHNNPRKTKHPLSPDIVSVNRF